MKKKPKVDRLNHRTKFMTNRRNKLLLKLFNNTTGETEEKLLKLSMSMIDDVAKTVSTFMKEL